LLGLSKSEGFGMNVLECQALGTPVITNKFYSMDDFTKYGVAVPSHQQQWDPIIGRSMAMPDVDGIVEALEQAMAKNMPSQSKKNEAKSWIDSEFSELKVMNQFRDLITQAQEVQARRDQSASLTSPPVFATRPLFTITSGEHPPIANWTIP